MKLIFRKELKFSSLSWQYQAVVDRKMRLNKQILGATPVKEIKSVFRQLDYCKEALDGWLW